MARYIDADKFKSNLEKAMEKMHLIGGVKGVDVGAVITALDRQPTADVVPKSEYDAVVSAVDNSTQQFLKLHDDYQEQKTECDKWKQLFYDAKKTIGENAQRGLQVTLEEIEKAKGEVEQIFEEIEKYKRSPMPECKPVYVINDSSFAELKKKYTDTEDKT